MGMRAAVTSPWKTTATGDRLDWNDIKDRVDMAAVATALFGPAPKRSGRRLLWPCPFHDDHDPSLQVDPAERRWKCWPCNLGGDAPALVMRLKRVEFPEAVRIVAELAGIVAPSRQGGLVRGRRTRSGPRPGPRQPPRPASWRPTGPARRTGPLAGAAGKPSGSADNGRLHEALDLASPRERTLQGDS